MVKATHLENLPWHQVHEKEGRRQEPIPVLFRAENRSEKSEIARFGWRSIMLPPPLQLF
jgi:hypothetical protein